MKKLKAPKAPEAERKRALACQDGWKMPRHMPNGRVVEILTSYGQIRLAERTGTFAPELDRNGTVHCWAKDFNHSDLSAIRWREPR